MSTEKRVRVSYSYLGRRALDRTNIMATRTILLGLALLGSLSAAAADSASNAAYTYAFWVDKMDPQQFYATSTGWRLTHQKHISRAIDWHCGAFIKPVHRPFSHGWTVDHTLKRRGVELAWLMSRHTSGYDNPNITVEDCMQKAIYKTYPTLEIALLCSWLIAGVLLVIIGFCCCIFYTM